MNFATFACWQTGTNASIKIYKNLFLYLLCFIGALKTTEKFERRQEEKYKKQMPKQAQANKKQRQVRSILT